MYLKESLLVALILHLAILFLVLPVSTPKKYLQKHAKYIKLKTLRMKEPFKPPAVKKKTDKRKRPVPEHLMRLEEEEMKLNIEPENLIMPLEEVISDELPALPMMRAEEVDKPPVLLTEISPDYPAAALIANQEGEVTLELVISTEGNVKNIEIIKSSGRKDLDEAAVKAAKVARFSPAMIKNEQVEVLLSLTVDFTLQ